MKFHLSVIVAILSFSIGACQEAKIEKKDLKTQKDSISYAIGLNIGQSIKKDNVEINDQALHQGIKDAIEKDSLYLITTMDVQHLMSSLQQSLMQKQAEKMKKLGDQNKKEGDAFLAENAKKQGVKTLPSGLQYKVLASGSGQSPKATDKVKVNYRGTLINGTEFDNSFKRGQPAEFAVNQVIKGWTEALQLMKVGDKWQLFVPADLAYGPQGMGGGQIPPNATLIFEVELLSIEK